MALTLPIVLIALLLIVQVGIVVRDALALAQAAREGVRTAAITARDDDAIASVRASAGPLDANGIAIDITPPASNRSRGSPVMVSLAYTERLHVPIVDHIVSLVLPLHASATMRLERDQPTPTPAPAAAASPGPSP